MSASLPPVPSLKDSWPLLLLIVVTALHPLPGGLLVLMGVVSLWSRRATGLWPWQAAFWDRMQWTLAGALGVVTVGTLLHVVVVRPIWDWYRSGA